MLYEEEKIPRCSAELLPLSIYIRNLFAKAWTRRYSSNAFAAYLRIRRPFPDLSLVNFSYSNHRIFHLTPFSSPLFSPFRLVEQGGSRRNLCLKGPEKLQPPLKLGDLISLRREVFDQRQVSCHKRSRSPLIAPRSCRGAINYPAA